MLKIVVLRCAVCREWMKVNPGALKFAIKDVDESQWPDEDGALQEMWTKDLNVQGDRPDAAEDADSAGSNF